MVQGSQSARRTEDQPEKLALKAHLESDRRSPDHTKSIARRVKELRESTTPEDKASAATSLIMALLLPERQFRTIKYRGLGPIEATVSRWIHLATTPFYATYTPQEDWFLKENDFIAKCVSLFRVQIDLLLTIFEKTVALSNQVLIQYETLSSIVTKELERWLRDEGLSRADSSNIARAALDNFRGRAGDREVYEYFAVELAVATLAAVRKVRPDFFTAARDRSAARSDAPQWVDRVPQEFPTAESFLKHHYGARLGIDGDLTLSDLGRLDPPLLNALNREFSGTKRRGELHDLLPTLKKRNDAKLLRAYGHVPQGLERKHKLSVLARGEGPKPTA